MSKEFKLREYRPSDLPALEPLYRSAFPDEDLLPLVHKLLGGTQLVQSAVCAVEDEIAGHIIFTMCELAPQPANVALLGPLCVLPAYQKQGLGSDLVREGVENLSRKGTRLVLVLGDPAYYGRLGFKPDTKIAPPYPMPEEWKDAWQSLMFPGEVDQLRGELRVPGPWQDPALWGP